MEKIAPSNIWQYLDDRILIDVRSPAEYAHAHIPTALNLPLFDDDERAQVGTTYKQISPDDALIKGLEIVGPKMAGFVKTVMKWAPNKKVIVYCWRGGKRSGSMAWLLKFAGFDVLTTEGGYKNYRNFILQQFENQRLNLIVLGGKTGSGKTYILKELKKLGEQVIDLEALAHHKGSAFGWIGEQAQVSTEQFENDVYEVFKNINPEKRVWVENESRSIGTIFINQGLWNQMRSAPIVHLEVPFDKRIKHLVDVYAQTEKADLIISFEKITKKLGFEHTQKAIEAVKNGDYPTAANIALTYYDKAYVYSFDNNTTQPKHILNIPNFDFKKTAEMLVEWASTEGVQKKAVR